MPSIPRWETREFDCPEGEGVAHVLIEWAEKDGRPVVKGISCDNPRLSDLDNWDCKWSCWKKIEKDMI
jgi:hypothetical protein